MKILNFFKTFENQPHGRHIDSLIFKLNKYKAFKMYSAHPIHENSAPVSPIATIAIAFSVGGDFLF